MHSEIDWTSWTILGLFVFGFICLGAEPFVLYVWPHVWPLLKRLFQEFMYWSVSDDWRDVAGDSGDGPAE
jgi:hypothetical protein